MKQIEAISVDELREILTKLEKILDEMESDSDDYYNRAETMEKHGRHDIASQYKERCDALCDRMDGIRIALEFFDYVDHWDSRTNRHSIVRR